MEIPNQKKIEGIRLKVFSILTAIIVLISAVALIIVAGKTSESQASFRDEEILMAQCLQDCRDLQSASDFLTDASRSFVVTGNPEYVKQYFNEVNSIRRRDLAVQDLQTLFGESDAVDSLEKAFDASVELQAVEYYAMRLKVESMNGDMSFYPEALQQVELSDWDKNSSSDAQLAVARDMLFNESYHAYKEIISNNVNNSTDQITDTILQSRETSTAKLTGMISVQYVLIAFLLFFSIAIMALLHPLVVRPLEKAIQHINNGEELDMSGAFEVRFLAATYNYILEKARKQSSDLQYEVDHDALTGLYNRGAFARFSGELSGSGHTLVLVDIDNFKTINDTYGHDVGDAVLKRLSHGLSDVFREDDYVCRIGGDEFAVLMKTNDPVLKDAVTYKIEHLNSILERGGNRKSNMIPGFTISAGAALADSSEDSDTVFKHADSALYVIKRGERRGCAFYSEEKNNG